MARYRPSSKFVGTVEFALRRCKVVVMSGNVCFPVFNGLLSPLGMLLRYFVNFYDMEIIEEEAFLAWKEDITQEFPGKGKALFQVMCTANILLR